MMVRSGREVLDAALVNATLVGGRQVDWRATVDLARRQFVAVLDLLSLLWGTSPSSAVVATIFPPSQAVPWLTAVAQVLLQASQQPGTAGEAPAYAWHVLSPGATFRCRHHT